MSSVYWLSVLLLCLVPTVLPGDAPWINEEPTLILKALHGNELRTPATMGLEGSHGIRYGPLPLWFYQAFLALSHDLRALVVVKALLTMLGAAAGLTLLAEALNVSRWWVLIPLLSPYLWFYSRILWDNTFLIPLSALAVGAYGRFLVRPSRWSLAVSLSSAIGLVLVHLMAAALLVPMAVHALFVARAQLWRYRWTLVTVAAVGVDVAFPYLAKVLGQPSGPAAPSSSEGWMTFALLGPRFLSAHGLEYFFNDDWEQLGRWGVLISAAKVVSGLAFAAGWAGIALTGRELVRARRSLGPRLSLLVILTAAMGAQTLLAFFAGAVEHPHYYNATWVASVAFVFIALDEVKSIRALRWLPLAQGASLAVVLVAVIARMHIYGGTRGVRFGPTLGNQIAIAQEIGRYDAHGPLLTDVLNYQLFPQALVALERLQRKSPGPARPATQLQVVYAGSPPDAHVKLEVQ